MTSPPQRASPRARAKDKATLELLRASLPQLRRASDVSGLLQIQAVALALAQRNDGGLSRQAARLAKRASGAARKVKQPAARPLIEAAPSRRKLRESSRVLRAGAPQLERRLLVLSRLILRDATLVVTGFDELRPLAASSTTEAAVGESLLLPPRWAPFLLEAYERSRALFADVEFGLLSAQRFEVERFLAALTAQLCTDGEDVRGLTIDPVPLVGYALFAGQLPTPPDSTMSRAMRRVEDLLVFVSRRANVPAGEQALFAPLLRLSVVLGEADEYVTRMRLTVTPPPPPVTAVPESSARAPEGGLMTSRGRGA